jgi:hypothetical protein
MQHDKISAKQTEASYTYKKTREKLLEVNAAVWFSLSLAQD